MNETMTNRQSWAIFCASKFDVRNCKLTFNQASNLLCDLNNPEKKQDGLNKLANLEGAICKGKPAETKDWKLIFDEAHNAGMLAGQSFNPTPMVVQQHENPLNDNSKIKKSWFVSEGVCGFASIIIKDGRCSFANWLRKNKLGDKHYYGGTSIWVGEFGQSMQRKEAYAHAFCKILSSHGIECYSTSRMD